MAAVTRVVARRRTQATRSTTCLSLDKKLKKKISSDYDEIRCEECGSGDHESELLLCDGCDRGFHLFCLTPVLHSLPTTSTWFCSNPICSPAPTPPPRGFPLVQTKIIDFFRIQRSDVSQVHHNPKKRQRRTIVASHKKKRRWLLPFSPSEDCTRRLEQMASLATALTATGAQFSNDLTYDIQGMAPRSANSSSFEKGGMQVLSKQDKDAFNLCKAMMANGECPPLMVVFDPLEGFTVEADKFIKDLTIITEYVGDVDYLHNRENDDGDSIMTLLSAAHPCKTLVICPDKRSNIARFINGINNHTPEGKKKQNLKCVRFDVDGEARVLLIANRDISKGERLYYDYNAYEHEYPTHHFV
ncbi:hypothetical protein QVD17_19920 [Tagetes erecta]|uniref:[histone H3]-lysine(27) N-methyltransferase n=1 Tax=Tagetes erecta TaxID=13708 RepID=A0AAD8KQM0_TARER|nr:hypothetical protein QVD17_19920 [Tagetes erecta]